MEIVGQIYAALDDDDAYAQLPRRVANAVGARSATFMSHSPSMALEELFTHYFSKEMTDFYAEKQLDRLDSWWNTVAEATQGRSFSVRTGDYQTPSDFEKTFFCREFIRNFGDDSTYCMGFRSARPDGGIVTLGLHKPRKANDFDDNQLALIEALRPHITRVVALRRTLLNHAELASGALLGVNQIEDGYLVLRADRRISFANTAAEILFRERDLFQPSEGKLYLRRLQDDQKLARALNEANNNKLNGKLSFLTRDSAGKEWRFTLAPKTFGSETMILVWIDRCQPSASAPDAMQQIYGLTKAELPILMAVSEGHSAAEISEQRRISIATVRSHIQHIYQKTGVNKASQLAQLVSTLPKLSED